MAEQERVVGNEYLKMYTVINSIISMRKAEGRA